MSYSNPPGGVPQTLPSSTTAIISLVSGILGLTLLPFVGSIVAVITGPMAKREIRESGGALGGEGIATAGIIIGWIGIILGILAICGVGIVLLIPLCITLGLLSPELFNSFSLAVLLAV